MKHNQQKLAFYWYKYKSDNEYDQLIATIFFNYFV